MKISIPNVRVFRDFRGQTDTALVQTDLVTHPSLSSKSSCGRPRRLTTVATVVLLLSTVFCFSRWAGSAITTVASPSLVEPDGLKELRNSGLTDAVLNLAGGWSLQAICKFPEKISSLAATPENSIGYENRVFVGTQPQGSVYMFNPLSKGITTRKIATGLGDLLDHGTCVVNHLSVHDMDHDGLLELVASTSQIFPAGVPRLYAWKLGKPSISPLGVARPNIRSHWSHGIAFAAQGGLMTDSSAEEEGAFITFCGEGEVVEYRLASVTSESGFVTQSLGWKVVGQLPASGEWSQSDDVDGDGRMEICLATGYAKGMAAIHIYGVHGSGQALVLEQRIDEDGRFANVRFISAQLRGDGSRDLIAWWQTDHLYGGECEMISYRLGPEGIRARTVIATGHSADLQPDDGQFQVADLDGDNKSELWFATSSGKLLRYQPEDSSGPEVMLQLNGGIGPIAASAPGLGGVQSLYLGWGQYVAEFKVDGKSVKK